MSLIDAYLKKEGKAVVWRVQGPDDDEGAPTYTDTDIKVLWTYEIKTIKKASDQELQQVAFIQCKEAVSEDDTILYKDASWPVLEVEEHELSGVVQFRIARLGQRMI